MAEAINKDNLSSRYKPSKFLSQTSSVSSTARSFLSNLDNPQYLTEENFILIWLDTYLDIGSHEYSSFIEEFQKLVNLILPFNDPNRCIEFIMDTRKEKIFLIISGSLGKDIVPMIEYNEQIDSIYVYCDDKTKHEKWANKIKKVKGVFQDLRTIFDAFRRDIRQCQDDLIPFHILSSDNKNNWKLNQTDQLFIYTQLFKDLLLEINNKSRFRQDFIDLCFDQYLNNFYQFNLITQFKNEYRPTSSISWYTKECFISSMLNKALRIQDTDKICQMGFFIHDIHETIKQLKSNSNVKQRSIVYRGQGITETKLNHILESANGFLSFNNFFIARTDKFVSRIYANFARENHGLIGVVFEIEIDRSKSIFTQLDKQNYDSDLENQILFSIQNIFQIQNINQTDDGLWQIQLKSTINEDELIKQFKNFVRDEIENKNSTERLNVIATKLMQFNVFENHFERN